MKHVAICIVATTVVILFVVLIMWAAEVGLKHQRCQGRLDYIRKLEVRLDCRLIPDNRDVDNCAVRCERIPELDDAHLEIFP